MNACVVLSQSSERIHDGGEFLSLSWVDHAIGENRIETPFDVIEGESWLLFKVTVHPLAKDYRLGIAHDTIDQDTSAKAYELVNRLAVVLNQGCRERVDRLTMRISRG